MVGVHPGAPVTPRYTVSDCCILKSTFCLMRVSTPSSHSLSSHIGEQITSYTMEVATAPPAPLAAGDISIKATVHRSAGGRDTVTKRRACFHDPTFADVQSWAEAWFADWHLKDIAYTDEEGDVIEIGCQEEWVECLNFSCAQRAAMVQVTCTFVKGEEEEGPGEDAERAKEAQMRLVADVALSSAIQERERILMQDIALAKRLQKQGANAC